MRKFYLFQVLYSIYALLQMCAPTIIVECTKKQMETVKYKLYTRLMEKNGEWLSLYYITITCFTYISQRFCTIALLQVTIIFIKFYSQGYLSVQYCLGGYHLFLPQSSTAMLRERTSKALWFFQFPIFCYSG